MRTAQGFAGAAAAVIIQAVVRDMFDREDFARAMSFVTLVITMAPLVAPMIGRVLLFMFYLNDVEEGGETEFYYQNRKIAPKKGSMVVAPGYFTHTHRGNKPVSNDK